MAKTSLRANYPLTCCICQREATVNPSINMQFGANSGVKRCPACKTFLHVEISPDLSGDRMVSEDFTAHLDRIQKEVILD